MPLLIALVVLFPGAAEESHLLRAAMALEDCAEAVPDMTAATEAAAERMAGGGRCWIAGHPGLVSEFSGRAGGLMMVRRLDAEKVSEKDVSLYFRVEAERPDGVFPPAGYVVGFGPGEAPGADVWFDTQAARHGISASLAGAIYGWVFTGELVAALTRRGKMPVVYESIGAYGGYARIQKYGNGGVAWHEDMEVPAIEPGVMAARYIEAVAAMLRRADREEAESLARAAAWARVARQDGKKCVMYSMGHLFPGEIEETGIGSQFESAVWNGGFPHSAKPAHTFGEDDCVIHIGYQHPPEVLLRRAISAGARAAYVSVRPHRDFLNMESSLWIDPMWDWPDGCVEIAGYDVPALPASGIVNAAIAWEIYRLAR